jgi:hypothetical protein
LAVIILAIIGVVGFFCAVVFAIGGGKWERDNVGKALVFILVCVAVSTASTLLYFRFG